MDLSAAARSILDAAPTGMLLVDSNGSVRYANRAATALLALGEGGLTGREWRAVVERLARERGVEPPGALEGCPGGSPRLLRIEGPGGEPRWVERRTCALGADGRVEYWTDVTERERAAAGAAELELAVEDQRMILDNMAGFTYRHDVEGVFHFLSPSVERITGYPVRDWMSHYTTYLTDNPINDRVVQKTEGALLSGRAVPPYRVEIRHRDGSPVMLEVTERPYFDEGRVAGIVGIAFDITERERLQLRLQHIQKLESMGLLAGGIAHDFNNLLLAIQGNAGLVADELPGDSLAREPLEEIFAAARRAGEVCQQMLAYTGKAITKLEPVDLSAVVAEMARMLEVSISKKARLVFELGEGLPHAQGDPVQISQVVLNLLTNASEALQDEAGEIVLRTGSGHFTKEALSAGLSAPEPVSGTYVWLEVQDTGAGMDERTMGKMFDPFFSTKFVGRGLGSRPWWASCAATRARSASGPSRAAGTRLRALFPVARGGAESRSSREVAPRGGVHTGLALFVDDEPAVRKVGRRMLEKLGHRVVTAAHGRAGLELFERLRDELLFCMLDMTMPEMGGDELFRELRRRSPDLPVLLTSGYDEGEAAKRMGREANYTFLQKPFTREGLEAALGELLGPGRNRD